MKHLSLLAVGLLCSLPLWAQESAPKASVHDTLTITTLKAYPVSPIGAPFMSDSLDPSGMKYDTKSLLKDYPFLNRRGHSTKLSGDARGFVSLGVIAPKAAEGLRQTRSLVTTINVQGYEKGTLLVESTVPFRAFVDGRMVTQSDARMALDSIKAPQKGELTLHPGAHEVLIRLIDDPKAEQEIAAALRVRYASARPQGASAVTTDAEGKKIVSLDFMMNGGNLSNVSVSPTGKYLILYERVPMGTKSYTKSTLYQGKRQLRSMNGIESMGWMPDQDKLYYTRTGDEGRQLITLDVATMKEEVLHTSIPNGNFYISSTGRYLIYDDSKEGQRAGAHVTRLLSREDRTGSYRTRHFQKIFDVETGAFHQLTFGYRSTSVHDINADDSKLIFATSHDIKQRPFSAATIMELDLKTMKADTLFASTAHINSVYYTSDPNLLLMTGDADAFDGVGRNLPEGMIVNSYDQQLFVYNRANGKATPVTKHFDPSVGRVRVLVDKPVALFTAEDKDCVHLYRLDITSGAITKLSTKEDMIRTFATSRDGSTIAYVGQSISNSDRAYLLTGKRMREELLYDFSAIKLADYTVGKTADWTHTMPNGDKVQGRYYLPPHFDASKKYPMIVYYYGGTSPVGRSFEGAYSYHMYAAQGYVVYVLNPSGTTGFGQEYSSRHVNAWGKRTADEIVASVKAFCAEHSFVDAKRIGCMGASYGGFMTQYLQTITDIFAAAASHAGISAISSYWGEGFWGVGYSFVASADSYPWNNPDLYVRQSPLFNADKINTPLLLLHGTADTNVPDGESVQMYNALKLLGKEVEFLRIHNQDHFVLDREKRIEWTYAISAWFAKWLKGDDTWWNAMYPKPNL